MNSIPSATARRKRLFTSTRSALDRADDPPYLGALTGDLFGKVSVEDLAAYGPAEIAAFVRSASSLIARRTPGNHLIRISDQTIGGRGKRRREITLVELLNDDMPFLVDSVIGEIEDFGAEIRLVAHPVVTVSREQDGRLGAYHGLRAPGAGGPGTRESLMQIHIDRPASEEARKDLAGRLDEALRQVRRAVSDWRAMRRRLEQAIEAWRSRPPPIDADDRDEALAFLEWLLADNFTLLGMRQYEFAGRRRASELKRVPGSSLGILRDPAVRVLRRGGEPVSMTPEIRAFLTQREPLFVTKTNIKSRVHRRVYMDYVGLKLLSERGKLVGELRIIGLFTSTAYTRSARVIPFLRRKVASVMTRAGHDPEGHSGKALVNVLESYPRDELFQIDEDLLYTFAHSILALEERPRLRALVRADKFDRYVSVIVFIPRDRYDSAVRQRIGEYLSEIFEGHVSAYYPAFPESVPLARVHFIIGRSGGKTPSPDQATLEAGLAAIVRTWADELRRLLLAADGPNPSALIARYEGAFPAAYRGDFAPATAVEDVAAFEALSEPASLAVRFHAAGDEDAVGLTLIHHTTPIALSVRVPMLENIGFRVIEERSYEVRPVDATAVLHVHDMTLAAADGGRIDLDRLGEPLTACLLAVWRRQTENDGYNALVLTAGLDWRSAALLRAVSRYLRQAGTPYPQHYMWATFARHGAIAAELVRMFRARFDPDAHDEEAAAVSAAAIETALEGVESLDEDRIMRRFANVILAMVRTNYFQRTADGGPPAEITFKLDSQKIEGLPEPRPFREIFVHAPRLEGVHLRFGKVARGGLRWSDRPHDFRTEILGLAKAQQVKNAVIVPVGAKGGFVPQWLPAGGSRDDIMAEGTAAYRIFIASLLALTDNLDGETVVSPDRVVRHEDDDPYLVVAADKGTATFSDLANAIADERGFWLSDAFASGGSHGYDHKAMGITARGAWEAVKRHFREIDIDVQSTPFTVVGVGDMSGDVFGNGMLLSPHTRLVAAFDHRDIFIDPDPDPATSLAERQRLFALPRSSWQDYDRDKISAGGGVYSRRDKSIRLGREARAVLGMSGDRATPQDVMRAILKAKVDLLWFGGIGTFVKTAEEADERVGDRANDAIRITAGEIGARVVGEGGNLAMTQRARIAFGLAGGRCNSDAIDNSAGVNCSDVEVNIKIALARALRAERIDMRKRNRLLKAMTDDVAGLVLRNNYLQTLAISLTERRGFEDFDFQFRLMQDLEGRGRLDRSVESLPDDAAMAERRKAGKPLTRAEIGVLLAYAKIVLFDDLLATDVVDDPALAGELVTYFPGRMRAAYAEEIGGHRLRREIVATQLANEMINAGGPTYPTRMAERAAADVAQVARAYVAVRDSFALADLNGAIDGLDGAVTGDAQMALYRAVQTLLLNETVWFMRNASIADGIGPVVAIYRPAVEGVAAVLDAVLPERFLDAIHKEAEAYHAGGVPEVLAERIVRLPALAHATDIRLAAVAAGCSLKRAAAVYFAATEHFRIARIVMAARSLPISDHYDAIALDRALGTLDVARRQIAIAALKAGGDEAEPLEKWLADTNASAERVLAAVTAMTDGQDLTVSRATIAADLLADLAEGRP
jgi:glutamate dehydrogenase